VKVDSEAFDSTSSSSSSSLSGEYGIRNASPHPTSYSASNDSVSPYVERLDWVVDKQIEVWCVDASTKARRIVDDSDASMLVFEEFGSEWVKDVGMSLPPCLFFPYNVQHWRTFYPARLSPDAFAQLAMQLAYYRTQGCFTATYETAATHMFIHGRTDVIRSFSREAREFVKGMSGDGVSVSRPRHPILRLCLYFLQPEKRKSLLLSAIKQHNSYTRDAIRGRGIDRHLLGLKLQMRASEKEVLFEDEMFGRSETWKLSTSGLYNGERFDGTGLVSCLLCLC